MIYFPDCKINIGLDILRRRSDGYHEIDTVMYSVTGLCDILEITEGCERGPQAIVFESGDGVPSYLNFSVSGDAVDCPPEKNLCVRAFGEIARIHALGIVDLHLHKAIPSGAGLGGGSADAAYTIKGLNEVLGLGMNPENMRSIAASLGSDVPFFIEEIPQRATGRGEILEPFDIDLSGRMIIIVKPPVFISTARAYADVRPEAPAAPLDKRLQGPVSQWQGKIFNKFEESVFAIDPVFKKIKNRLKECGAEYISMSGSGAAIYGIFAPGHKMQNMESQQIDLLLSRIFPGCFVYQQIM